MIKDTMYASVYRGLVIRYAFYKILKVDGFARIIPKNMDILWKKVVIYVYHR